MLVTFSGIDGAGKSTYAERVAGELSQAGYPAEVARPRYLTCKSIEAFCELKFGSLTSFVDCLSPQVYLHALMADWLDFYTLSLGSHENRILVCDRYLPDVFAQLLHYGADPQPALDLVKHFPTPQLSYLLEITPRVAADRIEGRGGPRRELESLANLEQLERIYCRVRDLLGWSPITRPSDFNVTPIVDQVAAVATASGVAPRIERESCAEERLGQII